MTRSTSPPARLVRPLLRLPTSVGPAIRWMSWACLVTQTAIVGTGGAVRLTGSGLGCPDWPQCTPDSLVPTAEMGIHGAIEFGNRLLSIIVGLVVLVTLVLLLRLRRQRRDLFLPAVLLVGGTALQGLIGGISVRVQLDPNIVGLHFAISVALVVLATALVYRAHRGPGSALLLAPDWFARLTSGASVLVAITIAFGILTTGSGPHAGDRDTPRNGLDPELLQHVHSWPAYALLAITLVLVAGSRGLHPVRQFSIALLGVELAQIAVGITQARLGLPEPLVGIHLILACVLAALMTSVVLSLRAPAVVPATDGT